MSDQTVYLVSGVNRGIGLGILTALLARPNVTVVAAVRDTSKATHLSSLPKDSTSSLILVQIESTQPETAHSAIESLSTTHNITHLDVVIANAGIADYFGAIATTPLSEYTRHYEVNVLGPIALFQASFPLLQAAVKLGRTPKFVGVSSGAGSLKEIENVPMLHAPYGMSKATLNFVLRKMAYENKDMIIFPIHPGWLKTDMGNKGAEAIGLEEAPTEVKDGVNGVLDRVDNATKEISGTFQSYDGTQVSW